MIIDLPWLSPLALADKFLSEIRLSFIFFCIVVKFDDEFDIKRLFKDEMTNETHCHYSFFSLSFEWTDEKTGII